MYDSKILYVDHELSRLFSEVRQRGIAENTLFIVTSDHGEEFFDHGNAGHGRTLYQELLHVPLIMSGPEIQKGYTSGTVTALYDIMPTVISYMGVIVPDNVEGKNILFLSDELIRDIPSGAVDSARDLLFGIPPEEIPSCAVLSGSDKVIAFIEADRFVQYDLLDDPAESNPFAADSSLSGKANRYWTTPPLGHPPLVGEASAEVQENLHNLGYLR